MLGSKREVTCSILLKAVQKQSSEEMGCWQGLEMWKQYKPVEDCGGTPSWTFFSEATISNLIEPFADLEVKGSWWHALDLVPSCAWWCCARTISGRMWWKWLRLDRPCEIVYASDRCKWIQMVSKSSIWYGFPWFLTSSGPLSVLRWVLLGHVEVRSSNPSASG